MTLRKSCPRCGATSTSNAFGQQYWGVQSKIDGRIICKECAIEEVYDRMFPKEIDTRD